jgi:hypothetical protein
VSTGSTPSWDTANFPPQHQGQVAKIVAPEPAALLGEPIGMGRPATALGNGRPLDQAGLHEPFEPLPDGGRRHAQSRRQIPYTEGFTEPEEFDHIGVGGPGLWLCRSRSHTLTVAVIGFLTSGCVKNFVSLYF